MMGMEIIELAPDFYTLIVDEPPLELALVLGEDGRLRAWWVNDQGETLRRAPVAEC